MATTRTKYNRDTLDLTLIARAWCKAGAPRYYVAGTPAKTYIDDRYRIVVASDDKGCVDECVRIARDVMSKASADTLLRQKEYVEKFDGTYLVECTTFPVGGHGGYAHGWRYTSEAEAQARMSELISEHEGDKAEWFAHLYKICARANEDGEPDRYSSIEHTDLTAPLDDYDYECALVRTVVRRAYRRDGELVVA